MTLKTALAAVLSWFRTAKPVTAPVNRRADIVVSPRALESVREWGRQDAVTFRDMYPPAKPMDGNAPELAMDDALFDQMYSYAGGSIVAEGMGFLGYPYLAQLTQRTEYRMVSEIRAEEMTRKWIELQYAGDEADEEKLAALAKAMDDFCLRDVFRRAVELDGEFGRSQIFIDTGDTDNTPELQKPLLIDKRKIGKGKLRGFVNVEPIWSYPSQYNAQDPLRPDFYKPQAWYVQGKTVHTSRMLTIVSKPVPDILKPAYSFGGLSLTQMVKPYVDNWLRTRQSVSDLIHSFSVMILQTDMNAILSGGAADDLMSRLALYTELRDNRGMFAINKDTEDMKNVAVPLSGLDKLQAQAQEQMASPARTPLVKLFGITPSGLNASTDGEIQVYYDSIHAGQEKIGRAPIMIMLQVLQLHLWGEIDPNITFAFVPLHQMNELEAANVRKLDADTDAELVTAGILDPAESRKRLASDKDSAYSGLDVDDVPEAPDSEEDGDLSGAVDMAHDAEAA